MTTTTAPTSQSSTATRRLTVLGVVRAAGDTYRRLTATVHGSYNRRTGNVLAVHCPACRRWVKPKHYRIDTGTCIRCRRQGHRTFTPIR
ncbi:hypothetical protein [Micromonospora sp. CPCC 206061]|uniref:hypothetical protein n=1 Tax=Micromonospora sp. CPCC 206061 TaxID=3122410 RepID=UPI002FF28CC1